MSSLLDRNKDHEEDVPCSLANSVAFSTIPVPSETTTTKNVRKKSVWVSHQTVVLNNHGSKYDPVSRFVEKGKNTTHNTTHGTSGIRLLLRRRCALCVVALDAERDRRPRLNWT